MDYIIPSGSTCGDWIANMPARDLNHDIVCRALIKSQWTITDDPFVIDFEDLTLFADLAAEQILAAEKQEDRIVIEIKTFAGPSVVREFQTALGHYELYRGLLEITEPDRVLFLAVSDLVFNSFFQREAIQLIVRRNQVRLLIIDMQFEEIVQWIR